MNDQPRLRDVQCSSADGLHRMGYYEWGEASNPRVLVCVHGLTRVGRDFDDLARSLSSHYRVVCPDVMGRGRSDRLSNPMLYQIPTYVADMVTLLARLDAKTVHWFGTSMGGLIGMALASLEHSPIERMVLNDVGPIITLNSLERISEYLGKPMRFTSMDEAEAYIRAISAPFGPHSERQWRFLTDVVMKADGNGWIPHYDPAIAIPFKALLDAGKAADMELWSVYDRVRCPTLAVRGALSDLLTVSTHEQMGQRGPHAQLVTIDGVGHAPTFLHADQIAIARDFLLQGDVSHG